MSNLPLVSVIIPAYNCAKYIPATLDSLFAQDYPNLEILVVNDGSKDDTLQVLTTYGDRLRLIDQENTGAPGARNTGIAHARGDLICFCDADDIWAPHKVSAQARYLQAHPAVGMVYCSWHVWQPNADGVFETPPDFACDAESQTIDPDQSGWIYHRLLLDCLCLTSSVMLRRTIMERVGLFDTSLWNGDDYDYWLRTSRLTEVHKLKAPMVLYRILPLSVARTPTSVHYEYQVLTAALTRWGSVGPNGATPPPGALRERLAAMRFGFGYLHLKTGDPMIAVRSFWSGIRYKPFWYLPWAFLLLSLWKHARASALPAR